MRKSSVSGILLLALLWVANVAGAQNEPKVIEAKEGALVLTSNPHGRGSDVLSFEVIH